MKDLGAQLRQLVDRIVDAQLVAGHWPRADDHGVPAIDVDGRVVVVGDPDERRQRLALRARAEDQHLAGLVLVELDRADQGILRHVDVAEVARDVQVLAHRAPDHADLAADVDGNVDCLLHAVDVGGERGDEDPPLPLRDDLTERLADETLRAGHPRPLGVGRVREQEIDAAVAELGEAAYIRTEAVHRRVIELPVARVQDASGLGLQHDGDRVGNRVRHPHEFRPERAKLNRAGLGVDLPQLRGAQKPVLVQLRFDEPERQPRRPDLIHAHLAEQVRQ